MGELSAAAAPLAGFINHAGVLLVQQQRFPGGFWRDSGVEGWEGTGTPELQSPPDKAGAAARQSSLLHELLGGCLEASAS